MDTEERVPHGTSEEAQDTTLGGYFTVHTRPPAFEGCDGQPYTVSIETERSADLRAPVAGYLVFPRWAQTGLGVIGHVESPLLWTGATSQAVETLAGETPLAQVQQVLNEAIVRQGEAGEQDPAPSGPSL